MMKKRLYALLLLFLCCAEASAASISLLLKGGYVPELGGSMHSSWQAENLGVMDGINDINRSGGGINVSSIEAPVGFVAGLDARLAGSTFYLKSGVRYVKSVSGGSGSTLNDFGSGVEKVDVTYSVWFVHVPVTAGIIYNFWDEAKIYLGGGTGFAYGVYSNSFSSASAEHSARFAGYAAPLVAELGCEYILGSSVFINCGLTYIYGKSDVVEDDGDYGRIDFTCYSFTAGIGVYFDI